MKNLTKHIGLKLIIIFLKAVIVIPGCQSDSLDDDYDVDTESWESGTDTLPPAEKNEIEAFEYCGQTQCRPIVKSSCIDEGTVRTTIPFCAAEDFFCFCYDDQRITYPFQNDIECEKKCFVNASGQDICQEDFEALNNEVASQFHIADVDWEEYYPTGDKLWW